MKQQEKIEWASGRTGEWATKRREALDFAAKRL
jgi:hypothetical protein